jgi:hypothetical protein
MSTEALRVKRRKQGLARWRVIRYADDFAILVHGTRTDVETLQADVAAALALLGLRLSEGAIVNTCGWDLDYAASVRRRLVVRSTSLPRLNATPCRAHQGFAPSAPMKAPVGPSSGRVARWIATAAPSAGGRYPVFQFRSVLQ